MTPIAAILLAAGAGSRMGQTKQLLRIGETSLVRRAAVAALDAGCDPVIAVTGSDADSVAAEIADLDVQIIFSASWSAGIGTSIRAGIAAMPPSIDATILTLCDQPHLDAKILRELITIFRAGGKPMAACQYAGTLGPPCCFDKSMFSGLSKIPDAAGAKKILLANPSMVTAVSWPQGSEDLDTPADWSRFCQNKSSPPE